MRALRTPRTLGSARRRSIADARLGAGASAVAVDVSVRGIARRLSWSTIGQVLLRLRAVLTLPPLVAILGLKGYGQYATVWAATSLVVTAALLNIPDGAGRLVYGRLAHVAVARISTIRRFGRTSALAVALVGAAAAAYSGSMLVASGAGLAASMILFKTANVDLEYFQRTPTLVRQQMIADISGAMLSLVVALAFGSPGAVIGVACGYMLGCIRRTRFPEVQQAADWRFIRRAAATALPLMPVSLAAWILYSFDMLVLASVLGSESAAVYAAAYSLAATALVLLVAVNAVWAPTLAALLAEGKSLQRVLRMASGAVLAAGVAGLGLTLAVAPYLSVVLRDVAFERSETLVPVLVFGFVMLALAKLAEVALYLCQHTRSIVTTYTAVAALSVLSTLVIVPKWGVLGAAWVTAGSYSLIAAALHLVQAYKSKVCKP